MNKKAFLNFISDEQKAILLKVFVFKIINRALLLLIIIAFIFSGTLFGAKLLMNQEIETIRMDQQNSKVFINGDENATIESAIKSLNATTSRLTTVQSSYVQWTRVLQRLEQISIVGIEFDSVEINALTNSATIQGTAVTRDAYFDFENELQGSTYIISAELPLSLLKTEIPFNIELALSPTLFSYEDK